MAWGAFLLVKAEAMLRSDIASCCFEVIITEPSCLITLIQSSTLLGDRHSKLLVLASQFINLAL